MDNKKNIDRLVEEILDSVSSIDAVKTPPFFKDKVLNRMAQNNVETEDGFAVLNWFTPKFQAAALICFVVLNAFAFLSNSTDSYSENVENFAEVYGLSETGTDSYLYQN